MRLMLSFFPFFSLFFFCRLDAVISWQNLSKEKKMQNNFHLTRVNILSDNLYLIKKSLKCIENVMPMLNLTYPWFDVNYLSAGTIRSFFFSFLPKRKRFSAFCHVICHFGVFFIIVFSLFLNVSCAFL